MPSFLSVVIWYLKYWFTYIFRFRGNKINYLRYLGVRVGKGCSIYNSVNGFSDPWLIEIGNNVTLTSGVLLITHDGATRLFRKNLPEMNPVFGNRFGTIRILDNCFIGVNTVLLPGIVVGPNSIVGSGSIVTHDVPAGTVCAGNPARLICTVDEYMENSIKKMIEVHSTDRASLRKELSKFFWQEER